MPGNGAPPMALIGPPIAGCCGTGGALYKLKMASAEATGRWGGASTAGGAAAAGGANAAKEAEAAAGAATGAAAGALLKLIHKSACDEACCVGSDVAATGWGAGAD